MKWWAEGSLAPATPVYADDQPIGHVTSGTQSPTLKRNVGYALVTAAYAQLNTEVEVEIRGKRVAAKVVQKPFYKRKKD